MSQVVARIAAYQLPPLYVQLTAQQARLADILEANEADMGMGPGRSLRRLDREQFAAELRELLRKAGVKDPDYVYNARGYRIIGPPDRRLQALGRDSSEQLAVRWLLIYQEVRKYEAQIAAAREGRTAPPQYVLPEPMPTEEEWLAEKLRQLEQQISEARVEKPQSSRKTRKQTASERPDQDKIETRRDDGRDSYNKAKSAEAAAREAQAQALADELWRKDPNLSKLSVAKQITPKLAKLWHAENERRELDGEKPSRLPPPSVETIRRRLRRP